MSAFDKKSTEVVKYIVSKSDPKGQPIPTLNDDPDYPNSYNTVQGLKLKKDYDVVQSGGKRKSRRSRTRKNKSRKNRRNTSHRRKKSSSRR